ncbi:oxidoreductase [Schumannella sp. 10F1B-5-1]|uniref:oxidoreductase n=1 Tax=Schumannella sp. 10F1B-5-1 TaxID=2590780 RepID=UPI0011322C62|nr:oxidoreductase [Schumannella sp. 10F1B-5-1]TPW72772.1 oxidoreductase [Schumannella sp. 10F1B-5-1]
MIARLDAVFGRVTMYRLVAISLTALAVVAAVFAATGVYVPIGTGAYVGGMRVLAMLASLAVAVVWASLANIALAALFRARFHSESSVITGLLLFFILPPTLDPIGLLGIALAAVIASASKWLIAPHGRHLLNPAAFGAFMVGLLGIATGSGTVASAWWAASAPLLPFLIVIGLAIAIRTRRGLVMLTFAVVAAISVTVRFATSAVPLGDAVNLALVSSPVIFFAVYMITEPLTLPPRRWQQLLVAAVVGVLFAVPFSLPGGTVGPFNLGLYATPELWLLVGNVLAFLLARRRGIRLELVDRRQLTPTSWEFHFTPAAAVPFAAGQFLELDVPHRRADSRGTRRTFSIASPPHPEAGIRLGLRVPDERPSTYKRALLELPIGAKLSGSSVGGDFTLPGSGERPLLLVAGGIGITPFIAQLEHLRHAAEADPQGAAAARDVVLVYAVSSLDEIAYAAELGRSGARVLLVSPQPMPRMPQGWEWLGDGRLDGARLLEAVPDAARREVLLSGPPALIAALRPALRRAGAKRIRTDAFLGY